jgi:hypothetical protein
MSGTTQVPGKTKSDSVEVEQVEKERHAVVDIKVNMQDQAELSIEDSKVARAILLDDSPSMVSESIDSM